MLKEGRKLLSQAQHAVRTTRAAAGERLTIGFYGSAGSRLLPDVLSAYSARRPDVAVSVRELLLGDLDDVLNGRIDLAFTRLLPGQVDLAIEVLTREPRLIALAGTHRLAERRTLTFSDLRHESFIVNPATPTEDAPSRWLEEQRRHGLPGRIAARSATIQEILTLVAAGRGVCLVPATVAHDFPHPGVAYVPVVDADPAVVSLAHRHGETSRAVQALILTAREIADGFGT